MTRIKHLILALALMAGTAFAWAEIIDGIHYNLDSYTLTAEVGDNSGASGDIVIPVTVTDEHLRTYTVTGIESKAFLDCSGLTSVTFAAGSQLTSIGDDAFSRCSGLTAIDIPAGVTSIGYGVFVDCSSLSSVTFASGSQLTSIGENAFYRCTALESITIPNTVTGIGEYAFYNCSALTSIEIPSNVTTIGYGVFVDCSSLSSVTFASGSQLTSIGENAFGDCSGLTAIDIPSSVTSIGTRAFASCTSLQSISIPSSVTSIGNNAFNYCSGLNSITVDSNNPRYDSRNNCNAIIETATNKLLTGCKNTVIPASVTNIGDNAFSSCSGLTAIDIPAGVTSIGRFVFNNCNNLADVTVNWTDLTGVTTDATAFGGLNLSGINLHLPFGAWGSYSGEPWSGFKQVPVVTAKADPENDGVYYNTFYHGSVAYALPTGVEAYTAKRSGTDLVLTKIAGAGDVLPYGTAVILKSTVASYEMTPSDATPVTVGENDLLGVDAATAAPTNCYVLSGGSIAAYGEVGVGFYQFTGTLGAHKAYLVLTSGASGAPRRLPFIFDSAQDIESLQSSETRNQKKLVNGILYIECGGHTYNTQGQIIK